MMMGGFMPPMIDMMGGPGYMGPGMMPPNQYMMPPMMGQMPPSQQMMGPLPTRFVIEQQEAMPDGSIATKNVAMDVFQLDQSPEVTKSIQDCTQ
jgi:hypothetical protein